jgi:hypothetical protein
VTGPSGEAPRRTARRRSRSSLSVDLGLTRDDRGWFDAQSADEGTFAGGKIACAFRSEGVAVAVAEMGVRLGWDAMTGEYGIPAIVWKTDQRSTDRDPCRGGKDDPVQRAGGAERPVTM